jgi:hypothetical protein
MISPAKVTPARQAEPLFAFEMPCSSEKEFPEPRGFSSVRSSAASCRVKCVLPRRGCPRGCSCRLNGPQSYRSAATGHFTTVLDIRTISVRLDSALHLHRSAVRL